MSEGVRIGSCHDIPVNEGRKFLLKGEEIGIFNLGTSFHAISNRCPHRGGPLSDGMVIGKEVICPLHARKINLENGSVANEKERVKVCGLKILDGEIFLPEPS